MSRIDTALHELNSLDALAARPSAAARLDARAKILATLACIVAVVSFDRYAVLALFPFALFPLGLAALGNVPLPMIGRKLLLASPFALMVGIFNPVLDRAPLVDFFGVAVSGGWVSFVSILLRFCLTVAAALVLVATTGFFNVCSGLAQLGMPRVFTTQLLLLQRYAHVLAGEAARMNAARQLRACGQRGVTLAVYGSLLGHLLLRALERAQRIHQAMLSRGFDGELRSLSTRRWLGADSVFLALCLAGFALARSIDLPRVLGAYLTGLMA